MESESELESYSGPKPPDTNRQQSMILAERLRIVPKILKGRTKRRVAVWRYSLTVI